MGLSRFINSFIGRDNLEVSFKFSINRGAVKFNNLSNGNYRGLGFQKSINLASLGVGHS